MLEDYFEIFIEKVFKKPITRIVAEGVFIVNYEGEIRMASAKKYSDKNPPGRS